MIETEIQVGNFFKTDVFLIKVEEIKETGVKGKLLSKISSNHYPPVYYEYIQKQMGLPEIIPFNELVPIRINDFIEHINKTEITDGIFIDLRDSTEVVVNRYDLDNNIIIKVYTGFCIIEGVDGEYIYVHQLQNKYRELTGQELNFIFNGL